jgi:hypothetical protein
MKQHGTDDGKDSCSCRDRHEIEFLPSSYPADVKVSDREMAAINIAPHAFHGEWNYTIHPTPE